jgi:dihydropteroate synthase
MGVLNITPDSFSDPGHFFSTTKAVEHALQMEADGAQIIDIGGESTRPGAKPVALDEELARVIPAIRNLKEKTGAAISADTSKAEVARAAVEAGASIVNDVTGGRGDSEMRARVAAAKAGFIIMHMQGTPQTMQIAPHYDDVVAEVRDFFRQQYACAIDCGIDPMAIAFDPGIGFGKTLAHNLALLKNLAELRVHDRPIVIGVSRKSFLGKIIGSEKQEDRRAPTIAITAMMRERGVDILRVHEVKENAAALRAAEAVRGDAL